jgi:hypothetical protein
MAEAVHLYRYLRSSALDLPHGHLGLETSGGMALAGPAANPRFFTGFLASPEVAASALAAVARVARARYYEPSRSRGPVLEPSGPPHLDPVVTCGGDRLRFESFSGCCGVYARLDLLSGALDGEVHDRGTTNVDIGEPLRRMLARVVGGDPLHLAVGPDELAVTTLDGAVVERKVPLPQRWLRGFAELQVILAGFEPRAELNSAAEAARFLGSQPRRSRASGAHWVLPAGRSLRQTSGPAPGAVCLPGPQRLEALVPLLPYADTLRVYGPAATAASSELASAWELDLPGMRLVIALSPEVRRGFSGEGAAGEALADANAAGDAELVDALLAFEPRVEVGELADRSGLPAHRVRNALTQLGTSGKVGYDLAEAAYFHRELPYDPALVEQASPRLRSAKALADSGAVRLHDGLAIVTVGDHAHRVGLTSDGAVFCTCEWWAKYRGSRGSCTHVLAAELARSGRTAAGDTEAMAKP